MINEIDIWLLIAHTMPIIVSIMIVKRLHKKTSFYLGIFWCMFSSIPLIFYVYIAYLASTSAKSGGFSGIYFLISFLPAMILLLINMIILVTRKENKI